MTGHIVTLPCTRAEGEAAEGLAFADGDAGELADPPVLVAREVDEATGAWALDAYFADRPGPAALAALAALVPGTDPAALSPEPLPDTDWVSLSQQAIAPVRAGRFFVHTAANAGPGDVPPGSVPLRIEGGQAFGTGSHATTAGCLGALDALRRQGRRYRRIADIGTGTGLLAFAALRLWPRARVTASDIDPVAVRVALDNARMNGVAVGPGAGGLVALAATGAAHPRLQARGPYDLVIANILAGPLIALAPALGRLTAPGGTLILAGLTEEQAPRVIAAYRRSGFRLVARRVRDMDPVHRWPVLTLRRQRLATRPLARPRPHGADASYGSW